MFVIGPRGYRVILPVPGAGVNPCSVLDGDFGNGDRYIFR